MVDHAEGKGVRKDLAEPGTLVGTGGGGAKGGAENVLHRERKKKKKKKKNIRD